MSRLFRAGKDHPQYNPNLSDRVRKDRRWMAADIEWQEMVFERDGWTCKIKNERGGKLQAHHLNSRTHWPSLKFDINNGVTINKELHAEYHRIPGCKRLATAETFQKFYYEKTGNFLNIPDYILKHGPSEVLNV